ncbi:MAG: hypothetical protein OES79_04800 [Planctomycetota bacterium]|nr:hypothetical protein [Planctomycetota bacterium]
MRRLMRFLMSLSMVFVFVLAAGVVRPTWTAADSGPTDGSSSRRSAVNRTTAASDAGRRCASIEEMQETLKPISAINLSVARMDTPRRCPPVPDHDKYPDRLAAPDGTYLPFHWTPPGLMHNPLYFEDVPLERYGHTNWPKLQPAISGARFVKSAVTLPYRIGLDPMRACVYDLGYERPGNCAPSVHERLPWSWKGAALQTGAVVGGLYMFPLY